MDKTLNRVVVTLANFLSGRINWDSMDPLEGVQMRRERREGMER